MNPFQPAPTSFDLTWRMLGTRVRVHPSFWITTLIFGWAVSQGTGQREMLMAIGIWVACAFVSVLVHEFGHVMMGRAFGEPANVLLYSMGGYAQGMYHNLPRWKRILVYFAGPAIGFLFLASLVLIDKSVFRQLIEWTFGRQDWLEALPSLMDPLFAVNHPWYRIVMLDLVVMNLFWNIFNLLPIYPMDGGLILAEGSQIAAPRSGLRFALGLSFLLSGLIAVYSVLKLMRPDLPYFFGWPLLNAIMFGMLSFQNFQTLMAVEREQRRWEYQE